VECEPPVVVGVVWCACVRVCVRVCVCVCVFVRLPESYDDSTCTTLIVLRFSACRLAHASVWWDL
jgi:hypothetical protein